MKLYPKFYLAFGSAFQSMIVKNLDVVDESEFVDCVENRIKYISRLQDINPPSPCPSGRKRIM